MPQNKQSSRRVSFNLLSSSFLTHNQEDTKPASTEPRIPIKPAIRQRGKRKVNSFIDNRGFPDQSEEFDNVLHGVHGGNILRKRRHPAPPIDQVDDAFFDVYNESKHGEKLRSQLKIDHLQPEAQQQVIALVKKYWSVFSDKGLNVPVKDYECTIDTGSAAPVHAGKINYGPRETIIMRRCIASLEKLNHIVQIHDGRWLSKALLAPKPHQEGVCNIDDFVWRFCVNYIRLNSVTRVIAYPIPRCDSAVNISFAEGQFFWLLDAPSGYHQLRVAEDSMAKLAFAGPDAIKWTYRVMPFGPVNGPMIFISFMHDLDSTWKSLAIKQGIKIDDSTNTRLIVDDLFSWSRTFQMFLQYFECQLIICQSQNLSLSLKKTHINPQRLEFVGIDVSQDGNRPAMSKHQLLQTWPDPTTVRDVASLVGFAVFYASFIPHFETRVSRLRTIMKDYDYTDDIKPHFNDAAKAEWEDIKSALLADPCLARFDHRKRLYLRTDFSSLGFGYAALQPADDEASLAAMRREMAGGTCEFMKPKSKLLLRPVSFGGRRSRGAERFHHSYIGECNAGDWGINKCRHMCFGQRFTWITDCYAVKFIYSYDGANPAVRRLQMRLMCWDLDVIHRTNDHLVDADYWSRLGEDMCFDPLLRDYIQRAIAIRKDNEPTEQLPMLPENMPGFRGRRTLPSTTPSSQSSTCHISDVEAHSVAAAILAEDCQGHVMLEHMPVSFGVFSSQADPPQPLNLHNHDYVLAAQFLAQYKLAVYGFNNGHFASSIQQRNIPFKVVLAADHTSEGRALLQEFTDCPPSKILNSITDLYTQVRSSGNTSPLDCYLIHAHELPPGDSTTNFWRTQATIIREMRAQRHLNMWMAYVHNHDERPIRRCVNLLQREGWLITQTDISFPDYGDSIASQTHLIIGVHQSTEENATKLDLRTPPSSQPALLSDSIWTPFNSLTYAISFDKDDENFGSIIESSRPSIDANQRMIASQPKSSETSTVNAVHILYFLHRNGMDESTTHGAAVCSLDGLCPPYTQTKSTNLFGHYFGVPFHSDGSTYVRPISPFEFMRNFGLVDDLTYKLSQPTFQCCAAHGIPARTSAWALDHVVDRLQHIRTANCQIFDPTRHAAAAASCQVFVNGAVGSRLPNADMWSKAYEHDPEMCRLKSMIDDPSTITNKNLQGVHYVYRMG